MHGLLRKSAGKFAESYYLALFSLRAGTFTMARLFNIVPAWQLHHPHWHRLQ